jgi:hypothetical protein
MGEMMREARYLVTARKIMALGVLAGMLSAAAMLMPTGPAYASTTFTVNHAGDAGDLNLGDGLCGTVVAGTCTLRAAIQEANATTGADTIEFNISTTGVATITPASPLPKITRPLTIDGYSQPGARQNTRAVGSDADLEIELSGAAAPGADGLVIHASNSTVKGLVINRWNQGILFDDSNATDNKVTGNYIGTDPSGTQSVGNFAGVRFQYGSNNTLGGTTAAERNVLSGNQFSGVSVGDGGTTGNRVVGNYIGIDASGTKDLGNAQFGVNIDDAPQTTIGGTTAGTRNVISGNGMNGIAIASRGARVLGNYVGTNAAGTKRLGNSDSGVYVSGPNNIVGGTTGGARNVVSGNSWAGVSIVGVSATRNKVIGNYLGTDRSGTSDLGNYHGVLVYDAPDNTIGGTTAAERNVASGNTYGITIGGAISKATATGNRILGNYVGTDASGTRDLGNSLYGVLVVDTPNNTVGGTTAGARNVIAANMQQGVVVSGATATGNRILSNAIFDNGGPGIDLGNDGPTPNDVDDADMGANNLQNYPVLTSARTGRSATIISGNLDSAPDQTFLIQLFSNPGGTDEGRKLIGQVRVTTNGNGDASFKYSPKSKVEAGRTITATATGPGGNTSEFSAPGKVVAR